MQKSLPSFLVSLAMVPSIILGNLEAALPSEPTSIAVVKTYRDLENQPAISLKDGVSVKLGLEAVKAPRWSGVLVYCLTEGYQPPHSWKGRPLGPLQISFALQDKKFVEEKGSGGGRESKDDLRKSKLLFAAMLPLADVGKYVLQIKNADQVVAAQTFEGTDEPYHPWIPWHYLGALDHFPKDRLVAGIGLPSWGGHRPLVIIKPGTDQGYLAKTLPSAVPQSPEPGFRIAIQADEIKIESDKKFIVSRPRGRFLTRWWVNEKPVTPQQTKELGAEMYRERIETDKELTLPLDFEPARIGAKTGDRVALQLLFCGEGWEWVTGRLSSGGRTGPIWLSNRVEFVVNKK